MYGTIYMFLCRSFNNFGTDLLALKMKRKIENVNGFVPAGLMTPASARAQVRGLKFHAPCIFLKMPLGPTHACCHPHINLILSTSVVPSAICILSSPISLASLGSAPLISLTLVPPICRQ
uniref:Uncharacterized protein n=1 Tax=Setaria italica TaxID=4555 RepID=K3ZPU0_SETIT